MIEGTVIAVIPARGGSKGLPRKNIRPLGGIPLIARCIQAALAANHVDAVYVSSDSDEILAIAQEWGAEAIRRPPEISGDTASSEAALLHALTTIRQNGIDPVILVFLQCTSPFTSGEEIDRTVDALKANNADCTFAATEDHGFIWQVDVDSGEARGVTHDEAKPRQRRQDMAPRYRETGSIYTMRVAAFEAKGNRFCGKTILVPLQSPSIEIDTPDDWTLAEFIAATRA